MDYTKDHKSKVSSLLMERWGLKTTKNKEISHLCAMLVTEKATGKIGHPINHTLLEGGDVTHYDVEFDDVIVEGMPVEALDVEVQEEHRHPSGRRDYDHDKGKPRTQYVEVEDLEEASVDLSKNVQALDKRLDTLKAIFATIDDPKEVLAALDLVLNKIEALNPDFTDGEKRRTFTQIVKDFREEIKNVGKEDTTSAGSEKDKADKVIDRIKSIASK